MEPPPQRAEVALAPGGNLCRCAGHVAHAIQQPAPVHLMVRTKSTQPVDALEKVTGAAKYTVDGVARPIRGQNPALDSPARHWSNPSMRRRRALAGVVAVADPMEASAATGSHLWRGQLWMSAPPKLLWPPSASNMKYCPPPSVWIKPKSRARPQCMGDDKSHIPSSAEGFNLPGTWQNNVRRSLVKATSWRPAAARRRVETARAGQPHNLVEHTYRNAQQVHTALEPHASVASWEGPNKLTVYAFNPRPRPAHGFGRPF
ncbi:MAG: hypothetical protein R2911_24600 [Caldilineaceae bacterium]